MDSEWETCAGCGKQYATGHLCRTHMLCGICHPPLESPMVEVEQVTPMERLPCGCQFSTVGDTFVFEACSETCEWYLYVVAENKRRGKALRTIDLR